MRNSRVKNYLTPEEFQGPRSRGVTDIKWNSPIWRLCWKKCGLHKLTNKVGCIRTQYNLMAGLISYHSAIFIPQMLPLATMGIKVKTCYLKCINNDRDIVHESKCLVCSIWHKPNTVVKGDIVWLPNFLTLLKFGWPYAWHCFCKTLYKSITTTIPYSTVSTSYLCS
jgi:hypothetical protein